MNGSCLRFVPWLLLMVVAACSRPVPRLDGELLRTDSWPADFVSTFGSLPVQYEGRQMPVSTLAAFTLYAVHGQRDVRFTTGSGDAARTVKLSPTEWLLDVWCYPQQAAKYPLFRIENISVLGQLGFEHEGQKQGFEFLSYMQLLPEGHKLQELAERYEEKSDAQRSEVEQRTVQLFRQLVVYDRLHNQLAALHGEMVVEGDGLRAVFGGRERARLADLVQQAAAFRSYVQQAGENYADPKYGNLKEVLEYVTQAASPDRTASLFPPQDRVDPEWRTLSKLVDRAMRGGVDAGQAAMLAHLQSGVLAKTPAEKVQHLRAYRDAVVAAADARGEHGTVAIESHYYAANWHFHAMMTFVLGFLLAITACVMPKSRLVWWGAIACTAGALAMLTADIWLRCLITGYGPIQRLYDTFLFIAGGAALVLLVVEYVLPRRIALVLAPFLGALLILFARLFEVADGADTMRPLQAVLLSNFWLAVHVPTMNMGYFGGIAAAALSCAWVVVRALRIDHPSSPLAKSLVRAAYGVTCFALATSVVGTILGGVWANDSWGRFWGWDPKENGAMLICLSQIALLHARMSGMVRDGGFQLWSIGTGMVVVFSWFHTNLLGVGLHAYGFSKDLFTGVWTSYMVLGSFLVLGALDLLLRPDPQPAKASAPAKDAPLPAPAE